MINKESYFNFDSLSIIRGIAALYVVINHARGNLFAGGAHLNSIIEFSLYDKIAISLLQLTSLGQEFVIVFFVLSGFSIAYSIERNSSIYTFYRNRFLRLYPPYIAAVAFVFLASYLFPFFKGSLNYSSAYEFISLSIYLTEGGSYTPQYWSLIYEVLFYISAPFIFISITVSTMLFFCSAVLFSYSWFFHDGLFISAPYKVLNFLFDISFYFLIGAMTYKYFDFFQRLNVGRKKFYVSCFSFFIFAIVMKKIIQIDEKFLSLIVALFSIFIIVNVNGMHIRNKILVFLGNISYSLYLNHFLIIALIESSMLYFFSIDRGDMDSYWMWSLSIIPAVIFSTLMWRAFEKETNVKLQKYRMSYSKSLL